MVHLLQWRAVFGSNTTQQCERGRRRPDELTGDANREDFPTTVLTSRDPRQCKISDEIGGIVFPAEIGQKIRNSPVTTGIIAGTES